MEATQLVAGDIVRYRKDVLALVEHAWDSTMAPISGRLVSLVYLDRDLKRDFGRRIGAIDASYVEFVAHDAGSVLCGTDSDAGAIANRSRSAAPALVS